MTHCSKCGQPWQGHLSACVVNIPTVFLAPGQAVPTQGPWVSSNAIEHAERAIVDAADKWRAHIEFMSHARSDEETALENAVDHWRKLKGGA